VTIPPDYDGHSNRATKPRRSPDVAPGPGPRGGSRSGLTTGRKDSIGPRGAGHLALVAGRVVPADLAFWTFLWPATRRADRSVALSGSCGPARRGRRGRRGRRSRRTRTAPALR